MQKAKYKRGQSAFDESWQPRGAFFDDQAVTMVRNDKAVAMVADYPMCRVSVYRYPDAKLGTLEKTISYEPIDVALLPNDPLLVNWIQNFLQALEKTGETKMLIERWFKDALWVSRLP